MRRVVSLLIASLATVVLASCSGQQSVLDAHGPSAAQLKSLIIGIVAVCSIVWMLVMIVLIRALTRPRRDDAEAHPIAERRLTSIVTGAVAATAVIIAGFTVASFYATRAVSGDGKADFIVKVRGVQWWWDVRYVDLNPARSFTTANEIRIPVGKDVRIDLESADVIHSFWVPSLAGKLDLIPGRTNTLTLRADRAGVYRGQCAEFCGVQHSHMALFVIALDEPEYAQWRDAQQRNAEAPISAEVSAGAAVFMNKPCASCHTIRGTQAAGTTGPDLTHVADRRTIGAGLFDNTRGAVAAWIADPQTLKPGNNMPMVSLTAEELQQLSAYMMSLK